MSLWLEVPAERYGPADRDRLTEALEAQDASTSLEPVDGPEVLRLRPDGTTEAGYRFTGLALRQVCEALAPGLGRLVAGMAEPGGAGPDKAAHVYNVVLECCFARLPGLVLVADASRRVAEAAVGAGYRRLSNYLLWQGCRDGLAEGWEFAGAWRCGRQLAFWVRHEEPAAGPWRCPGGTDALHPARYLANAEDGRVSLQAAPALWRAFDGGLALGRPPRARVPHRGTTFGKRVAKLLTAAAAAKQPSRERLEDCVEALRERPLGLSGGGSARDAVPLRRLSAWLTRRGMGAHLARRGLYQALDQGAYEARSAPRGVTWSARTGWDLAASLMRLRGELPPAQADPAGRAAYALVTGERELPRDEVTV